MTDKATISGLQTGMTVDVLTADGKIIRSQRATGTSTTIPAASFNKSLLIIQVKAETGNVISSIKLMKH